MMKTPVISKLAHGPWRGGLALVLVLSLSLAFVPAAAAAEGHSTITLYTRGAPAGAWANVQWLDTLGQWQNVTGWQGPLEVVPGSNVSYKQWGVMPKDYGRGPFRWVVTTHQAGAVWATSPQFHLPDGDGATLNMTLAAAPAAADPETLAAQTAAGFGFATLVARVPNAPAGAWAGIQWQDGLGGWHDVSGWQGPMTLQPTTNVSTRQWAVYPKDYGRGPFRWVVYSEQDGAVWATSTRYNLPNGDGATLAMTLAPKVSLVPAEDLATQIQMPVTTLPAETSTQAFACAAGTCDHGTITLLISGVPAASLVGVQWADPFGVWHDVDGWQGGLEPIGSGDTFLKQWTVSPDLYGRGPFRWVLYNALGDAVLGVSPGFMLPGSSGLDVRLSVADAS
jgi:hypothetical protein